MHVHLQSSCEFLNGGVQRRWERRQLVFELLSEEGPVGLAQAPCWARRWLAWAAGQNGGGDGCSDEAAKVVAAQVINHYPLSRAWETISDQSEVRSGSLPQGRSESRSKWCWKQQGVGIGAGKVAECQARSILSGGIPGGMVGIEVPSDDDWRRKGLEEVHIQSRSRGRSIEVDHSEATSIEPETNGEDLQVGSRRGGMCCCCTV